MFIKNINHDDPVTISLINDKGLKMEIVLDGKTVTLKAEDGLYIPEVVSDTPNTRTFRLEEK